MEFKIIFQNSEINIKTQDDKIELNSNQNHKGIRYFMKSVFSTYSYILKSIICLFILTVLTTGCSTLFPKAEDQFKTYFEYGKYDLAIFSSIGSLGGIKTSNGKKYMYYNYGKLAKYGKFPKVMFAINPGEKSVWAVNNEINESCLFSTRFSRREAQTWSQEDISKEFFLCSSLNGFSPAMLNLASLITKDTNVRYGNSIDWLVKAAKYGNPTAIQMLKSKRIKLPPITINEETLKYDLKFSDSTDTMFANHDPVSGISDWNKVMTSHKENMNGLSNLVKIATVVTVGLAVADDMKQHPTRYNSLQVLPNDSSLMISSQTNQTSSSTIYEPLKSASIKHNSNTMQYSSGAGSCECICVNGSVRAICSSTIDIAPICSPSICPIMQPSIKPIASPKIAPIGTKQCSMQQVYNSNLSKYEWKNLCY